MDNGCRYDIDNTQTELSELDKAWLAINYPKKKKNANGKTIQTVIDDVKRWANILHIDETVVTKIADVETKPPAMRRLYNNYTSEKWGGKLFFMIGRDHILISYMQLHMIAYLHC